MADTKTEKRVKTFVPSDDQFHAVVVYHEVAEGSFKTVFYDSLENGDPYASDLYSEAVTKYNEARNTIFKLMNYLSHQDEAGDSE